MDDLISVLLTILGILVCLKIVPSIINKELKKSTNYTFRKFLFSWKTLIIIIASSLIVICIEAALYYTIYFLLDVFNMIQPTDKSSYSLGWKPLYYPLLCSVIFITVAMNYFDNVKRKG